MRTHYDTLGVVPAADRLAISNAYSNAVIEALPEKGFAHGSMKWSQACARIAALTEAMLVLSHGERKDAYDKTLLAAALICSLCDGKGRMLAGEYSLTWLPCIACKGTGKGTTYV